MENQYFLGSAFDWIDDKSTVCHNLIPIEIAYRIVDKINAGETFTAYINIPMFPEGDPSSGPSQEILFWQYRTMQSMYHTIVKAIQDNDAGTQPTDYLKFFCLGKREGPDEVPSSDDCSWHNDFASLGHVGYSHSTGEEECRPTSPSITSKEYPKPYSITF